MPEPVTEILIREKLEDSGELGKMKAMVVEAALKAISKDSKMSQNLFLPAPTLKEAKETTEGKHALAVVMDYLKYLGLNYTLNVLKHEASCTEDMVEEKEVVLRALKLPDTNAPILTTLIQTVGLDDSNDKGGFEKKAAYPACFLSLREPGVSKKVEPSGEDTTYFISKWTDKTFYRSGGQVTGQQIQLEYLTRCTVYILDPLDSITVDDCEGGELVVAACEGSVFLRNCKNMTVHVACKQLRTRDCEYINCHLFASTDPVIESSHHMSFAPFNLRLPELKESFKSARLDPKTNRFVHVYDFTGDDNRIPRPHFTVLYPKHGLHMLDYCKEKGKPECPPEIEDLLEGRIAPAPSSESGQNKSHDIKTGAQKWAGISEGSSEASEESITSPPIPPVSVGKRPPLAAQAVNTPAEAAPENIAVIRRDGASDESYSSFDDDDDDDDDNGDDVDADEDSDDF